MSFQDVAGHQHSNENRFGSSNNGQGRRQYCNRVPISSTTSVMHAGSGRSSSSSSTHDGSSRSNGGSSPSPPLREALLAYQQQVQLYEKLARVLGGPRDDAELRSQLLAQECVVKEVGARVEQQISTQIRAVEGLPTKGEKDRTKAEIQKMSKDAQRLKLRFENFGRGTAARIRELDLVGRRAEALFDGGSENGRIGGEARGGGGQRMQMLQQQQQQQQMLMPEDLDERLLQEREAEIVLINQSVVKVNEIFRDLGQLVSRQQEDIDVIEQNVQHSHAAAKSGLEQVEKAAKYQAGCILS
ncbi:sulfate permease family [Nannochloropsis oceanica]